MTSWEVGERVERGREGDGMVERGVEMERGGTDVEKEQGRHGGVDRSSGNGVK